MNTESAMDEVHPWELLQQQQQRQQLIQRYQIQGENSSWAYKSRSSKRRIRTKPGTNIPIVPFEQLSNLGPISLDHPSACPVCHLEFFDKSKFRHHYMVHTGEQPYGCSLCPFRSRQVGNLNRHVRDKHEQIRTG